MNMEYLILKQKKNRWRARGKSLQNAKFAIYSSGIKRR